MAREKKKADQATPDPWGRYFAMQLTPEQKAEARAVAQNEIDRARRAGVYERLLGIVGKVKWSVSWEELRRDDD